jgi:hypothetical protein
MQAISGDSKANFTASCWLIFRDSSKNRIFVIGVLADGRDIPRRTRTSCVISRGVLSDAYDVVLSQVQQTFGIDQTVDLEVTTIFSS